MTATLVSIWLFAFGALALAGYWRISRMLDAQAAQLTAAEERARRIEEALASLGSGVERLQQSIDAPPRDAGHEETDDATCVWQRPRESVTVVSPGIPLTRKGTGA